MLVALILSFVVAAATSAALVVALKPLLQRYALARPNARSSHVLPTPQGGGIAVVAAALIATAGTLAVTAVSFAGLLPLAAATVLLAVVGLIDDLRPLPAWPRLALQTVAVMVAILAGSSAGRLLPEAVPIGIERLLLVFAGLWFVNLVNFMDGLDWMTVAEIVPVAGAVALFGTLGRVDPSVVVVAAALAGAMIGFAPFNRPVARLFLGDVGSLPIGLLTGWMLYELAAAGAFVAALLLPLYYLADATLTLLRRLVAGERVFEAHRSHFYQRATANGFSVPAVIGHVFGCNLVLAGLALVATEWPGVLTASLCLAGGALAVGFLLHRFSARRPVAFA